MVEILLLGDICPRWGNAKQFDTGKAENVFHNILPLLEHADFSVANMEAPITNSDTRLQKTSMNLKAKPEDVSLLKKAGINALALANNHILDFGTEGLQDTFHACEKEHVLHFGAGDTEQAKKPLFYENGGVKIGFLAFAEREFNCAADYGIGANLWDDLESIAIIRKVRKQCDFLVVQYHGGIEEYVYPSPVLQKKCRAMAEAGADFITCQHSHCIGTREEWNGSEILYGQGNCIFGFTENNEAWNTGLIVKITVENANREITYLPIAAKETGEYLMDEAEATSLLDTVDTRSRNLNDTSFIEREWKSFCSKRENDYFALMLGWNRIFNKLNRLLHGALLKLFLSNKAKRTMMNIIRCDAHKEVMQTILEEEVYR